MLPRQARARPTRWLAAIALLATSVPACQGNGATASLTTAPPTAPRPSPVASLDPTDPVATASTSGPIRIPLSGAAPDAIVLDGATAWVLTGEGGTLLEVDLEAEAEVRSIDVGFGATHLALPRPGVAAVGRFDDSATGGFCLLVTLATGESAPIATGELGSLTAGDGGIVWALEKADRLVRIDAASGAVLGSTRVDVGENVHVEVRWAGGAAWVGSDGLPLVRVDGGRLDEHDTVEVDEGIPFLVEGGLLWGAGPSQLWSLDPASSEITQRIRLENLIEILALDIDGDEAWIGARRPGHVGTLLRLDLSTGEVVEELRVGLPAAVAIAAETVWVASYTTNELLGFSR